MIQILAKVVLSKTQITDHWQQSYLISFQLKSDTLKRWQRFNVGFHQWLVDLLTSPKGNLSFQSSGFAHTTSYTPSSQGCVDSVFTQSSMRFNSTSLSLLSPYYCWLYCWKNKEICQQLHSWPLWKFISKKNLNITNLTRLKSNLFSAAHHLPHSYST